MFNRKKKVSIEIDDDSIRLFYRLLTILTIVKMRSDGYNKEIQHMADLLEEARKIYFTQYKERQDLEDFNEYVLEDAKTQFVELRQVIQPDLFQEAITAHFGRFGEQELKTIKEELESRHPRIRAASRK